MTWKGILREVLAVSRKVAREEKRQAREFANQQKQIARLQEQEQATCQATAFDGTIESLTSVHKTCSIPRDWQRIISSPEPAIPIRYDRNEAQARLALETYVPTFWESIFGRNAAKVEEMEHDVFASRQMDDKSHAEALSRYEATKRDWEVYRQLAAKVINGDVRAYAEAITQAGPLNCIAAPGSRVHYRILRPKLLGVNVKIANDSIVPNEISSQTQTGKLSVKAMPKTQFFDIYHQYVCGSALRTARELFALLPIDMVIATMIGDVLNTATGQIEEKPIVSVATPRQTLESLVFASVHPGDAMTKFVHCMSFKRGKGFGAVEQIELADIQI